MTVIDQFKIKGKVKEIKPFGTGHINDTFLVVTEADSPNYLLQKMNANVFENIDQLMDNVVKVTQHIRKKLEENKEANADREGLNLIPTLEGKTYLKEGDNYWRLFLYVSNSVCHETADIKRAKEGGKAFGKFQLLLSDLTADDFHITIPDFHNLRKRLDTFWRAVERDSKGRVKEVVQEIKGVKSRMEEMLIVDSKIENKELPTRIVHCDTKLSNVLFDLEEKAICVIDLDTVMPGCVLSDFGDSIRTFANTGKEDDNDLSNVSFDMDVFKAYAEGFLHEVGGILTKDEINLLAFSSKYMTYMQAVRFLTDYLDGDKYFKTDYEKHNLIRTKAQLALLKNMEAQDEKMKKIIQDFMY